MEVTGGSCRLGLWHVHVWGNEKGVHQVRFAKTGIPGEVPELIRRYCAGHDVVELSGIHSVALEEDTVSARIYRAVQEIPFGCTETYGGIAAKVGTSHRAVGRAMARNPTPLVIPCHRVVATNGIGGFTPGVDLKEELLTMEKRAMAKRRVGKS